MLCLNYGYSFIDYYSTELSFQRHPIRRGSSKIKLTCCRLWTYTPRRFRCSFRDVMTERKWPKCEYKYAIGDNYAYNLGLWMKSDRVGKRYIFLWSSLSVNSPRRVTASLVVRGFGDDEQHIAMTVSANDRWPRDRWSCRIRGGTHSIQNTARARKLLAQ